MNNFNKKIVKHNFSQAAHNYDGSALVQKQAAHALCKLVEPLIKNNAVILDLGSGTSAIYKNLTSSRTFLEKNSNLFECDISLQMLETWPEKNRKNINSIVGDGENLPLQHESCDIIISSFALQWFSNFEKVFANFYSLLKKDGILAFCIPNSSSLEEIKSASIKSGCNFHFNDLPEEKYLESKLNKIGFKKELIKSEIINSNFDGAIQALKSLKEIGANYSDQKHFISKKQLQTFDRFYSQNPEYEQFRISWNISYFVLSKS